MVEPPGQHFGENSSTMLRGRLDCRCPKTSEQTFHSLLCEDTLHLCFPTCYLPGRQVVSSLHGQFIICSSLEYVFRHLAIAVSESYVLLSSRPFSSCSRSPLAVPRPRSTTSCPQFSIDTLISNRRIALSVWSSGLRRCSEGRGKQWGGRSDRDSLSL